VPVPEPGPAPTPLPPTDQINLDPATQTLIAHAKRTVFLIPFSHWDTDWHNTFPTYSRQAAANILTAIQIAKQHPRFRYTLEQVLFVKQFWETYPEHRADLTALIHNGQFVFASPNVSQPDNNWSPRQCSCGISSLAKIGSQRPSASDHPPPGTPTPLATQQRFRSG
jgi:hypothetical protein